MFVELKSSVGRLTNLQKKQKDFIEGLGSKVEVLNSKEAVKEFIESLKVYE